MRYLIYNRKGQFLQKGSVEWGSLTDARRIRGITDLQENLFKLRKYGYKVTYCQLGLDPQGGEPRFKRHLEELSGTIDNLSKRTPPVFMM